MPRYGPTQRVAAGPAPKPTFKLGSVAAGGAALARGTFQPSNRRQQARLHADVVAEANRLEAEHQKQQVKATYNRLSYQRELARQRGHGDKVAQIDKRLTALQPHIEAAGLTAKPSKFLGSAYGAIQKAEKIPVAGQLLGMVDPILLGKTAAANIKALPEIGTSRFGKGQVNAGMVFGRGGEIPKVPEEAAAIPEEVAAAEKVRKSLGPARARAAAQKGLYREERGKRIARAKSMSERAGGGEASFEAAKAELRGELPKVKFEHLREGKLSQDEYHSLLTQIQNHPGLSEWDKLPAQQALQNAFREGKVPRPFEIRHLETVFGQDAVKEIVHASKLVKAGKIAINVAGIPRSLMASYDISAPGRQGLIGGAAHPVVFAKTFKPMMRSLASEAKYQDEIAKIHADPDYERFARHGLNLTELGDLGSREEPFPSSYAEKLNLPTGPKGERFAKGFGLGQGVRASGRAYTGFLDVFRTKQAKAIIEYDRKRGINTEDSSYLRKVMAHVNMATGRGNLGPIESWGPALNALFFSPRLAASRVGFLLKTINPVWWAKASPGLRREMIRSYAGLGALTGGSIGAASALGVGGTTLDPRNADFLKLRMGNTRLDLLGGLSQYLRLAAQEYKGQSVSSTTGELQRLGPGLGQRSRGDIFQNFLTQKLAPTPSFLWYASHGRNYAGQPFNLKSEIAQRFAPLSAQDVYGTYQQTKSIPAAAASFPVSAVGVGVQSYGPRQLVAGVQAHGNALPKQILSAAKAAGMTNVAITPELRREIKLYTVRQSAYAKLRQQKGHLTPVDRFGADVQLLVQNKIATPAQAKEAIDWAAKAKPSDLKKARSSISRRYFKFTNLNYAVKVLGDHGQKIKLPQGG